MWDEIGGLHVLCAKDAALSLRGRHVPWTTASYPSRHYRLLPTFCPHALTSLMSLSWISIKNREDAMRLSLYLARQAAAKGELNEALFQYFIVLKTVNEKTRLEDFATEFAEVLVQQLANCEDNNFAQNVWARSLILFDASPLINEIVARDAYQRDEALEAIDRFEACIRLTQGNERVVHRMNLSNFKSQLFDAWHFPMINDSRRNRKFAEAIISAVTPGAAVFEIGAGTGILSLVAGKVSSKVTACEYNSILARVAKEAVEKNQMDGRVEILKGSSFEIDTPIKANVIITETMDCCVFGEGTVGAILDAHQRIAAPNCIFIPQQACVYVALLTSPSIHLNHVAQIDDTTLCSVYVNLERDGFSLSDDRDPYWCAHLKDYPDATIQSAWVPVVGVDFTRPDVLINLVENDAKGKIHLKAKSNATIHAIVASFSANLYDDCKISTKSGDSCWPNGIYPLEKPIDVKEGQLVPVHWNLLGGATRLEVVLDEELTPKKDDIFSRVVVSECNDILLLNNTEVQNYLISQIPSNTTRIHDITSIASLSIKLKAMRPAVELSVCQPEENLLHMISTKISADVMIAPIPGNQDLIIHWPLRTDGTLNKKMLDWIALARVYAPTAEIVPASLVAVGQLVTSNWLHQRTRPYAPSHLGFDLSSLAPFSLFEYRDISSANFPHTTLSDPFDLMPIAMDCVLDMSVPSQPALFNRTLISRITATASGECDGVVYWWRVGQYDSKAAGTRAAAFIFPQRIPLEEGDNLEIRADLYKGDLLVEATKVGSSL